MEQNPFKSFLSIIKYRLNLDDDKAAEADVIERINKSVEFKGTNLWTLIFAIIIASIGLNVNSTAVIIGAMLISPLMGPIMGLGLGAGIFDFTLIKKAAKNLFIATVIGLLASTVYFLLSPLNNAQSELLARTSPTIWDVLIAFFGGLAGIVAGSRKKYNNIIPGVAIATALMPPLCTAGYGIATGQWAYCFGAFYLYFINSVFISISTFLIVRFLKYKPASYVNPLTATKIKRSVVTIAVLTIIPSLYLAYLFVGNEIFIQNANRFITEEVMPGNYTIINKNITAEKKEISINILDLKNTDSLKQILEFKKLKHHLDKAVIIIKSNNSSNEPGLNINQLKEGIIEDIFLKQEEQIRQKNEEINFLRSVDQNSTLFNDKKEEAISEFCALFGTPQELLIERSILHNLTDPNDTIIMVYIKSANKGMTNNVAQIDRWLKTKFMMEKTKIVIK